jgi:hypothetical protein
VSGPTWRNVVDDNPESLTLEAHLGMARIKRLKNLRATAVQPSLSRLPTVMIQPDRQVHGHVADLIAVDNELDRAGMGFGDQSHLAIPFGSSSSTRTLSG